MPPKSAKRLNGVSPELRGSLVEMQLRWKKVAIAATLLTGALSSPASTAADSISQPVATKIVEFSAGSDISTLTFSPDGHHLAARSMSSPLLYVCDFTLPNCKVLAETPGEGLGSLSKAVLQYSSNGGVLAVLHDQPNADRRAPQTDSPVQSVLDLWDVNSGRSIRKIADSPNGPTLPSLNFSSDGRWLMWMYSRSPNASGDQVVAVNTANWERAWDVRTLPLHLKAMATSPDGKWVALGGVVYGPGIAKPTQEIWILDTTVRKVVRKFEAFSSAGNFTELSWSPDRVHLAAAFSLLSDENAPDNLKVFDFRNGTSVTGIKTADTQIYRSKFAGGGKYLIETGTSGVVTIWDSSSGRAVQRIDVGRGLLVTGGAFAVSKDGRLLAIAASSNISIWTLK